MTLSEAYIIAENYIKVQNEYLAKYYPGCGYIKGMHDAIEYISCFYFDFKILNPDGGKYTGSPLGGARGFIVSKLDGQAQTISWDEMGRLRRRGII
jgi:hypothetical protein